MAKSTFIGFMLNMVFSLVSLMGPSLVDILILPCPENALKGIPIRPIQVYSGGKKADLNSPIEVKNHQGEKLGEIVDFIVESRGRIPFVILSHGGKMIAVPYGALEIEKTGLVLDANAEKLSSAPVPGSKENSIDKAKAEEIYRYFGQNPYWTAQ